MHIVFTLRFNIPLHKSIQEKTKKEIEKHRSHSLKFIWFIKWYLSHVYNHSAFDNTAKCCYQTKIPTNINSPESLSVYFRAAPFSLPPQWGYLSRFILTPTTQLLPLQNLLWVLGVLGVMGGGLRGDDCWSEELWSKVSLLSPNWRLFGLCAFPDKLWLKQRVNKTFRSQQSCRMHIP